MIDAIARAIMILAARCLGQSREEWARAMQVEFDAGVPPAARLPFAIGCFGAACREMLVHREGRLSLASHAVALALFVPMAGLLLLHAASLGHSAFVHGLVGAAGSRNPFLAAGQLAAAPALLLVCLILGAAHLRLSWVLLEKDWVGVFNAGAMIMAGTITLALYAGLLFLHDSRLTLLAASTAIELAAVFAIARQRGESRLTSSSQDFA